MKRGGRGGKLRPMRPTSSVGPADTRAIRAGPQSRVGNSGYVLRPVRPVFSAAQGPAGCAAAPLQGRLRLAGEEAVAVDDGGGEVGQLAVVRA